MKRLIFAALLLATVLIPQTALSQVAKIGSTEYSTIEEAFSKATDGETITLVSNASISSTISVSKNITLDLQEYTISNSCTKTNIITVSSAGTLTIKGSGAIVNTGSTACNLINVLGTFKLESGTLRSNATNVGVVRIYNGNFNMTGGCIENVCSGDGSGPFDTKYTAIHIQYTKTNTTEYSTDITGGKISSNKTAIYNANYCTKTKVKIGDGVEITGYLCDNNGIGYYTSVPTYCILYSKAETVGEKENVIYDVLNSPTCTKLALSDNYKFYSPKSFSAKASSYSRNMANTWGTLCVPFAIDIESSNVECYSITGVSGTELTLSQHAANIDAGTPVVIKKKDESASQISIVGVASNTVCTAAAEPTTSDANMYGTFTGTTIKNTDDKNYYFIANNMFYQAGKDTTVPPYRSYFTLSKFNPNSNTWTPSPSFNIVISGNEITGIESAADTQDFFDGIVAVYNINGQRQDDIKPGVNIVKYSNGATRKIIVK
jgi:hypothetical protein